MRNVFLWIFLSFIGIANISYAGNLCSGVTGQGYGTIASLFANGSGAFGVNSANLINQREISFSLINWLGGMYYENLFFSAPTVKINQFQIINALDFGMVSTGKYESRDNKGNFLENQDKKQFIVSSINAIKINNIAAGVNAKYVYGDNNSIVDKDLTLSGGIHYFYPLSSSFDFVSSGSINNILANKGNELTPFYVSGNLGFVYYRGYSSIGVGGGYSYYSFGHVAGIGGYYNGLAGITEKLTFDFTFYCSYGIILNNSVISAGQFTGLKGGVTLGFPYFNIDYTFQNLGLAGYANSTDIRIFF